ncbi:MAG: phosphatase PAP2 family protein [Fimbriimonadaceae bacterium]
MGWLDQALFRLINGWPDSWAPLFVTLSEGNKWWPVRILLLAVFVFLVSRSTERRAAILAMLAWPLSNAATDALKAAIPFARPSGEVASLVDQGMSIAEAVLRVGGPVLRVEPLGSMGTASAHSANMAAIATVFALENRKHAPIWAMVALLTGISRIYVGVHYPSQVLLGMAVGVLVGFMVVHTFRAWRRVRASREEPGSPAAAS